MRKLIKKDKITILHIASTSVGGIGYNLLMLAKYMNKKRFELSFAIPSDSPFYEQIEKNGAKIYDLNISRKAFRFVNLKAFYSLWRLIKFGKYDIVHTHTSVGGLIGRIAAKINKTPFILWTIHGWSFDYPYKTFFLKWLFKILEGGLDLFTDYYVAISENMKEVGVKSGITRPEKIFTIYHGVEIEALYGDTKSAIKEKLGIEEGCPIIGTVGRLEPPKAIDNLIKAVRIVKDCHPNIKLIVVGDGPLRKPLEELAIRLDIMDSVVFPGWKENAKQYITCMDVFCLSSQYESFGIVLIEAMAAGKPIIATRVGGIPEIIENRRGGILISSGKPEELAHGICLLLSDAEKRNQMGCYNKRRVKSIFDVKQMIKRYEAMYEKLFK